eukprot:scaffold31170_cov69-Cyclotella_meneghiniana.AAC.7
MTCGLSSKIVTIPPTHSPGYITHGRNIPTHLLGTHALQLKMTLSTAAVVAVAFKILAHMAFTTHPPRFAYMPHILTIGRNAPLRFLELHRVFGVGEGPFGRNDGLAPVFGVVGTMDL